MGTKPFALTKKAPTTQSENCARVFWSLGTCQLATPHLNDKIPKPFLSDESYGCLAALAVLVLGP